MPEILLVTVPFFALVATGWVAAWRRWLPESAIPGLNAYVLFFALPAMLLRFGMGTPVLQVLNPSVLGLYLACALVIVFFTIAVTLDERVRLNDAAFGALVAAFPNTGFMGVPLLVALLGPASAGPMMCLLLVDLFITSSLCIALSQARSPAQHGARAAAWRSLRGALSNPLPWAIALGVLASSQGLTLTGPLEVVLRMLADSASPVALFTIGAVLRRAGAHATGSTRLRRYLPVALIKLVLHPALVLLLGLALRQAGVPLTEFQLKVMTLAAALPKHVSPDRMIRLACTEFAKNPLLQKCTPVSVFGAIIQASQLGLEIGVLGQAYLVPYRNKKSNAYEAQFIPGYKGLISLARRSGEVTSIETNIVYANDRFDLKLGLETSVEHVPNLDGDRGAPRLVYGVAKFRDGGHHFEWMTMGDVNKIRARSKASSNGPWVTDYEQMVRKTVIRRMANYLPMSIELQQAIQISDATDEGKRATLTIRAPFDGVVLGDLPVVGAAVFFGQTVAQVADLTKLEIEAAVGPAVARDLAPGRQVLVRLPTDPPRSFFAKTSSVQLAPSSSAGPYVVKVTLPNPEPATILVGMQAGLEVEHQEIRWLPRF